MRSVEGRHEVSRMGEFGGRKPLIIGGRIAQPVHEVVERGADETRVKNRLNFEVFITVDKVWQGTGEVRTVGRGFDVRG